MPAQHRNILALCLVVCATAARLCRGAEAPVDSFEKGLPAHWQSSRPGTISISGSHAKHGAYCLRWNWREGDHLEVTHGVGNIRRQGGYGGTYSKATFGIWLYMETPANGEVRIEFCAKGTPTGWFAFPLNFTGWRRAHLKYSYRSDFEGKVSPAVDAIVFHAPETGTAGTTFIDLVVYNGLMDYRQQWVPGKKTRTPVPINPSSPDWARPSDLAEREAARTIWQRLTPPPADIADTVINALEQESLQWGITPDKAGGAVGIPVVKTPGFYNEFGLEMVSPAKPCKLMLRIARTFQQSTSNAQRERLAGLFLAFADHLHDQGMAADSGFPWNWYNGRDFAEATLLMADRLRLHDKLVREGAYFDYNWHAGNIFQTATRTSMDDLHIDTRYRLYGALMQVTPEDQVRWLRAFSRHLSEKILLETGGGFKPDGSAFHHGFHYFAYANYSLNSLTHVVGLIGDTPFRISDAAHNRLKKVLLAMRFYCNQNDLPLPLCGRHPHSQAFSPGKMLKLAGASTHPRGRLDPDLAAAYLRFHPEQAQDPRFADAGITPEPTPQGNLVMNYAGLMAHRRNHWLAVVKGYSKYVTHGETYANNNRYGRYLSNGYLDILAGGSPVSRRDSGCVEEGWDWNRLDGTTVIYLPPEKLVPPSKGTEMLRSDQAFVGGLSHRDRNGIFVMRIHGAKHHDPTFRADNTYFLFDNRIICLGTGITNDDTEHPTQTNLFQKHLGTEGSPRGMVVDGTALYATPMRRELTPEHAHSILDPQGTGYIIPAGQRVCFARKMQRFPEQHDKKELEGLFATAWLDHGAAPAKASYEYAVLINASPGLLKAFRDASRSPATAPYNVLRHDSIAHIVQDRACRSWGYVFFEAFAPRPPAPLPEKRWARIFGALRHRDQPADTCEHPVAGVSRPCLVMVERRSKRECEVSITDPDLNLVDGISQPREVTVFLHGRWKRKGGGIGSPVRIVHGERTTALHATCQYGRTLGVSLQRSR